MENTQKQLAEKHKQEMETQAKKQEELLKRLDAELQTEKQVRQQEVEKLKREHEAAIETFKSAVT